MTCPSFLHARDPAPKYYMRSLSWIHLYATLLASMPGDWFTTLTLIKPHCSGKLLHFST